MNTDTDLAPLIELLKMEEEQWPSSEAGEVSNPNCSTAIKSY